MSKKFLQAPPISQPIITYIDLSDTGDNFIQAPVITQHLPDVQNIEIEHCSSNSNNQNGFSNWEDDPIFTRSPSYRITQEEIDKWNRDPINYDFWTLETDGTITKSVKISSKDTLVVKGTNIAVDIEGNILSLIGEDSKYTGSPTVGAVGGIPTGTVYLDKPVLDLIDELLHAYLEPTLYNFSILSLPNIMKVGTPITGIKTIMWDKTNAANIKDNSGNFNDLSNGVILKSNINLINLSRTTHFLILDNSLPFIKTFNISALTTKNRPIVSNNFTLETVFPMFKGSINNINPSEFDILSMTEVILPKSNQIFNYNINWKYFCFAHPDDYGNLVSIKDTNGFEIISGFTKISLSLTINNISKNYFIYISSLPTTQTNFNVTYLFN